MVWEFMEINAWQLSPELESSYQLFYRVNIILKKEGMKEMFDLTTHSTHFIYGYRV